MGEAPVVVESVEELVVLFKLVNEVVPVSREGCGHAIRLLYTHACGAYM